MQEVSAAWAPTIVQSHRMCSKVEILVDGNVELVIEQEGDSESLITDGQVTLDRDDKIRGRGSVSFVDPTGDLTPTDARDLLTPFGTEWQSYRGVIYPDGTKEMLPLGVNIITDVQIADTGDGLEVRLEGKDRARKISRAKFTRPWNIPAGTPGDMAIMFTIAAQVPDTFEFNMGGLDFPTAHLIFEPGDDPWEACLKIAQNCGCELFLDRNGIVVMQQIPDITEDAKVWTFSEGDDCTLLNMQRDQRIGDDDGYNHVIVTAEGAKPPVTAEAIDNNPDSPTYYLGPYGHVPTSYSSKQIVSAAQAQSVANAMLRESLGRWESLTFHAVANPALDPADVFEVNRAKSKLSEVLAAIDVISWPLTAKRGMEIVSRRRPI